MLATSEDNKMATTKLNPNKLYKTSTAAAAAAAEAGLGEVKIIALKRGYLLDLEATAVISKRLGLTPTARVWLAKNDTSTAALAYLAAVEKVEAAASSDKASADTAKMAARKRAEWRKDYNARIKSGDYTPRSK